MRTSQALKTGLFGLCKPQPLWQNRVNHDEVASMPSLVLATSRKALVESFAASVVEPGQDEKDPSQLDESATRRCSRWLADHNKRALLAPAGVGTIDQALLSVLCSKHQSLRLLGLWRKVLVVDEVHACDAYMQRTLETLLELAPPPTPPVPVPPAPLVPPIPVDEDAPAPLLLLPDDIPPAPPSRPSPVNVV